MRKLEFLDKMLICFGFFNRVNGDDVWVIESGGRLGLLQEATLGSRIIDCRYRQDLERLLGLWGLSSQLDR